MKNRKAIVILLVAISLLAGAHFLLSSSRNGEGVRRSNLVSFDVPVGDVSRLSIVRGSSRVSIVRGDAGWRLTEPYSAHAKDAAVMRMLDVLSQTSANEAISDAELLRLGRTRTDFELDPPRIAVEMSGAFGTNSFYFGVATPTGDGCYAAVGQEDCIAVVPTGVLAAVNVTADGLRCRSMFLSDNSVVSSFDIKKGVGRPMTFSRAGDGWNVDGGRASSKNVNAFLAALDSTEAVSFVWPVGATNEESSVALSKLSAHGLDPDSAVTVTLKSVDGDSRQISLGKPAGENLVYALVQNAGAIVTVPSELRRLAEQDVNVFSDARLFPVEPDAVASIAFSDEGVNYSFARDEKMNWRMDSPVSVPADGELVRKLLVRLLGLSASEACANGLRVSIATNIAPVTVSRSQVLGDLRFEDFRSKDILSIEPGSVRRIVLSPAHGQPTSVIRDREQEQWNVEKSAKKGSVSMTGIKAVLSAVKPLRAVRIEKLKASAADLAAFGLETPELTVSFDMVREGDLRRNILVGARTPNGDRHATVGSAETVFIISDETYRKLSESLVTP